MTVATAVISPARGDQTLVAVKVDRPPVIDGRADDPAWSETPPFITTDGVAGRARNPDIEQPDFGAGDVGERLFLQFR